MQISLIQAFKNVFSPKYSKVNIFIYILAYIFFIVVLPIIIGLILTFNNYPNAQGFMKGYNQIISILLGGVTMGLYSICLNNGYNKQEKIFPALIEDFGKVIISGMKIVAYVFVLCVILVILLGIFSFKFAGQINQLLSILLSTPDLTTMFKIYMSMIVCAVAFVSIFVYIPCFNFARKFSFLDLINPVKYFNLVKENFGLLCLYFVNFILLIVVCFVLMLGFNILITFSGINPYIATFCILIVLFIVGIIHWLLFTDLGVQFMNAIKRDDEEQIEAE